MGNRLALPAIIIVALIILGGALYAWNERENTTGTAPVRGWLDSFAPAARYDTRSNFRTAWTHGDTVQPKLSNPFDEAHELRCDMSERTATAGPRWRQSGILEAFGPLHRIGAFHLRINQRRSGASTYSLTSDTERTRVALPIGGVDLPVHSGMSSELCLQHASAGSSNAEGAYPLWYCALSFRPGSSSLRYVEFTNGGEPGIDSKEVRQVSGSCTPVSREASKPLPAAPLVADARTTPTHPPSTASPEPAIEQPAAAESQPVASEPVPDRQPRLAGDPGSICSSSLDGNSVRCGSRASICSTSLRGNDVSCGGLASICSSSLDGRRVACGGLATICTSSLNGHDVACGGDATICTSSLDGTDVACGGRATICTSSLKGNDVACGGQATICTTSLDGGDAACGGRARGCTTSLRGARACGDGLYSGD